MIYGSVCSGIEAATAAWHPLGWTPAFFSEIEAFPSSVLAHHYGSNMPGQPVGNGVPNHGDMTRFQEWPDHAIDLLVGGTPCQSFSVAGLRAGLADPRGNLLLTYLAIAARYRPRWLVWENVPGVLSSGDGRDFGALLGGLGQLGYGFAYRVLDAQFCRALGYERAVPQRRRRVFVVGYLGDWRRAAAVLFDATSLRGDPPPRREAGQVVAPTISALPTGGGGLGTDFDLDGGLISAVAGTVNAGAHPGGYNGQDAYNDLLIPVAHSLRADGFDASEDGTGRGTPLVAVANTLVSNGDAHTGFRDEHGLIVFDTTQITSKANRSSPKSGDPSHRLAVGAHPPAIALQGFANLDTNERAGGRHASSSERDAREILRALREAVGAEAFAEWRLGILDPLRETEVLRSDMHGRGVRRASGEARPAVDDGALSRPQDLSSGAMRSLWEGGPDGRSPQGRELAEQLAGEFGASLSGVPHSGSPGWAVRRLTPVECCRLQGFPDDYLDVLHRGKPAADGPKYKALGNSMAVNVMRVLGTRIAMVDAI